MLNKRDMYIDYKRSYKRRGRRRRKLPFILLLLLLAVSIGCGAYYMIRMRIDARNKVTDSKGTVPGEVSEEQIEQGQSTAADTSSLYKQADTGQNMKKPAASATVTPEPTALPVQPAVEAMGTEIPVAAKGIYVTSAAAGSKKLDSLVTIADTTEINALVIDIKDDHGRITYEMDSALAKEIGATTKTIKDMEAFIRKLKERNIYLIARIVAFKDPYLAKNRKDLAIKNKDGSIYRDNNGEGWINPYNRKVWEYLIEVASEAAAVGFDEIQFDYIRFSTGNGIADADFGKQLYFALENILRKQNILNLNACIAFTAAQDICLTDTSARFHEHLGYRKIGHFTQCGYKFGTWYDMIWMEKFIGEHPDKPQPVIPITELSSKELW
jgi:hypothetical protein